MEAHIVFLFVFGLLLFLQSAGRVKCEKSKQPKNDQNRSDCREHVFMSLIPGSENIYAIFPDIRIFAMNCGAHSGLNRTALVNRVTQLSACPEPLIGNLRDFGDTHGRAPPAQESDYCQSE
jgi:hypothetical protein